MFSVAAKAMMQSSFPTSISVTHVVCRAATVTMDVQEVLNIILHSNTLVVLRDIDDTVNIGSRWTAPGPQQWSCVQYRIARVWFEATGVARSICVVGSHSCPAKTMGWVA